METYRSSTDPRLEGKSNPEASGMFETADHHLYWERYGHRSDRLVLLLHHGLGSTDAWSRQIDDLVEAGWQVLVYDRWGYGQSDARPEFENHFLDSDAQEAVQLLDSFGFEKISLIGHSDGGTIGLMLAADHPQLIEKLVVVAAHIYIEPKMEDGLDGIAQSIENPAFIEALSRYHGNKAEAMARAWVDHWRRLGYKGLDIRDLLPKVECPTLVIQGEQDEHATAQHAHDIADAIQDSRLWLIPGVGHMPPQEVPKNFNHMVLDFLERDPPTPQTTSAEF
jgi:pimeloyl-ACP methyl ester carboxylesterase